MYLYNNFNIERCSCFEVIGFRKDCGGGVDTEGAQVIS